MITSFPRSLSFLRQEKGVSQRIAAQELGVSQALLSHYENGIREPGFAFLLKAGDSYNVSADFLLGRTLSREGTIILDVDAFTEQDEEAVLLPTDQIATLSRRLVSNSLDLLFLLLAQTQNEEAITTAAQYLSTAVYTLFRHLYQAEGQNSDDLFSVSRTQFYLGAARIDMLSSEMEYCEALLAHAKEKGDFPTLDNETLNAAYRAQYQSLLHIIHLTGERIRRQLDSHKNPSSPRQG